MTHLIKPELLQRAPKIALIGAGGTGSMVFSGLVRLHLSMLSLGHPGGLDVHVFDPDNVSESNVGRQLFYHSDIDSNKAAVLVNRARIAFKLNWESKETKFPDVDSESPLPDYDIIISCVDSRKSRADIRNKARNALYFIDCGNGPDYGQVIMGTKADKRLPMPWEESPELFDADLPEDNGPSCSLADALNEQELFINQAVATCALQQLWQLFRKGFTKNRGAYVNLTDLKIIPIPLKKIEEKRKQKGKSEKRKG